MVLFLLTPAQIIHNESMPSSRSATLPPLPPLPNACVRSEVDVRDIIAYDMTKPPHPRRILRIDFMKVIDYLRGSFSLRDSLAAQIYLSS